jgi:hypothetical protein
MKNIKNLALVLILIFGACGKSEVENLPINYLEPSYINSVFRIKSVNQLPFYKRIEFDIKKNNISSWKNIDRIILNRSMGAQSILNKDSLGNNDYAIYPSGAAWVVINFRNLDLQLSAPSDTFHFIVP